MSAPNMVRAGVERLQGEKQAEIGLSLTLVFLILAVFGQTAGFSFLHFDDNVYVTDNPHVRSGLTGASLQWAFTTLEAGFWHPLTWLSLMLDAQLYGDWAGGFHLTNVLLHGMSTLILFFTLSRTTGEPWRSAFVAGLFAFHPLHVESVAWVAERKDVLSGFFWMAVMAAYAWYAVRPGPGRYGLLLTVFILGLMAKPMLVTLPFALLLLDLWPLDRARESREGEGEAKFQRASCGRRVMEKVPLLILSAGFSVLTYWAESRAGALEAGAAYPLDCRIVNAFVSYAAYLEKMIWPAGLAAFYPHPGIWPDDRVFLSGLLLAGISCAVLLLTRRRLYLAVGWLWYLGTLIPVIGIVQIGNIAMADRFTYIPLLGPAMMLAWGVPDLIERLGAGQHRRAAWMAGSAFLAICVLLSWQQVRTWTDTESLFRGTLEVTDGNYKAHHGLGTALLQKGRLEDAEVQVRMSLGLRDDDRARNDLGVIYMSQGRYADAEEQFRRAAVLNPSVARYWNNRGVALCLQGRMKDAVTLFQRALQIDPDYLEVQRNLEKALE